MAVIVPDRCHYATAHVNQSLSRKAAKTGAMLAAFALNLLWPAATDEFK
jgi:hypothetical protein